MYTASKDDKAPVYHEMSEPAEYATLHHSQRDAARDARSSRLLWGADLKSASFWRDQYLNMAYFVGKGLRRGSAHN